MPDSLFASRTPRLDLPLLFAGQAQKEAYLNESLARLDALLHGVVEGVANSPPADAQDGQCWLVGPAPTGAWAGQRDGIACRQQGQWLFQQARDGLRLFNRATGHHLIHDGTWNNAWRPTLPTGGTTVDTALRTAFAALVDSLAAAGILPRQ